MTQPHLRFVSRKINKNKKYGQLNLFKYFEKGKVFKFDSSYSRSKGFFPDRDYLVVWYGHIRQNEANTSQILVKVALLELFDKHEEYIVIEIPFNYIIKVPVGSVWRGGVWIYQFELDENKLQINKKNSKFNSYYSDAIKSFSEEYPVVLHKSRLSFIEVYYTDKNDNPQTLLIHPLIFFMAHYGYSTELKRILLVYLWGEEGQSNCEQKTVIGRLLLDQDNPKIQNSVYLPSRFAKRDAVLLHFLKVNKLTRDIVEKLVNHIRTNAINRNKNNGNDNNFSKKIDLPIKPWHSDDIQFTFKSLRLNSNLSICTEITGMSEPDLPENYTINLMLSPSFKDKLDIDKELKEVLDGYYQPIRKKEHLSNIDLNPDDYANSLEVAVVKKTLMILGQQCTIQENREEFQKEYFRQALYAPEASSYTVGEIFNNRGGVGWVEAIFEAQSNDVKNKDLKKDRLGKLWNYAKGLNNKINGEVKAEWFTFSTGFNQDDNFIVMKLTHKLLCPKSYPYEILVLRITIDNDFYYIIDSDIRPNTNTGMPGVVIKVNDEKSFLYNYNVKNHRSLINILITLAHNEGSLTEDYIDSFNGDMAIFRHSSPHKKSIDDSKINWVLNGLKKLNTSINFK